MSDALHEHDQTSCGCCDGVQATTPVTIDNRVGLSAIAYRIGEYAAFKDSMMAGLSSSAFPSLAGLRTRDADDYTIALLDAVACAADVLTFYQERIANESYLRTATERVSLQELAKLTGYRLRPGVASEARLAFALEPPKLPPAGVAPDPGAFVTGIPASLTLVPGLKVQSIPGPNEKPQTFETVEALDARPEWNALRPWMSEARAPVAGDKVLYVRGTANNLKPGDAIVVVDSAFHDAATTNRNWSVRFIDTVSVDHENDRTRLSWPDALGDTGSPQVYVLRKRVGVFGNNAPRWRSMNTEFKQNYDAHADPTKDWPDFTISELGASEIGGHVDLDTVLADARAGTLMALSRGEPGRKGATVELYHVTAASEVSLAKFAISGKVSRVAVSGQHLERDFFEHVRETSVFAASEQLQLVAVPVTAPISGDRLPLAVGSDGLFAGRRLIISGDRTRGAGPLVHEATISAITADANGTLLTIAPPLPSALIRHSVVVYANVAAATHGETVTQVLGAGDASKSFQRFELKRTPLTYRSSANEQGADSELSVRVGDVEWTERPTLFGAATNERAYTLRTDEQGKSWIVFGDGVRGARLPSGVNNIRATYRQGLGQQGNVGANALTQLLTRPLGLKGVSNPAAAAGGTDPESAQQARRTMPLGTRTLGRAVSLLDYEDFAMAFTGIAKAQARVLQLSRGPTIVVTVAGQDGDTLTTSNPVWQNLLSALKAYGDPHVNLELLSYQASTFRLGLKVKRDPAYDSKSLLAAVEAALRSSYGFDARALGQPVLQSDVIAVAHAVPGVVAVDLDFLYGGTEPAPQTARSRQTRLLASRMRTVAGAARAAELLLLHEAPLDRLEEML